MFKDYLSYVLDEIKTIGLRIAYALPGFLTAVVVVLLTILLAKLIKNLLTKLLRAIGLNVFTRKAGIEKILQPAELATGVSELIGIVVYWLLLFLGSTYALRLAGLTAAEQLLDRIILALPQVFIATVVLVLGLNIAGFLGNLTEKAALAARIKSARWIGRAVSWTVILITVISIIEMLALNPDFIKVILYILTGCAAVSVTVILGTGGIRYGRDYLASRILQRMIQLEDKLLWNDQVMVVKECGAFMTILQQDSQFTCINNTRLLDNLVLVEKTIQPAADCPETDH